MRQIRLLNFIPIIVSIPAVIIGVIAMIHSGVPVYIWIQNIASLVIGGGISYIILSNDIKIKKSFSPYRITIVSIVLLISTFISSNVEGVHRWISIGGISLNIAMIVIPMTIIALERVLEIKGFITYSIITIGIAILITMQPDASQLTGFAIPMIIIMLCKCSKSIGRNIIIGLLFILIILSWMFLDSLQPVDYVEKILGLVTTMGYGWLVLGDISLLLLTIPFIFFPPRNYRLQSLCVGLYYIIILISTIFGNFPVPLMGYGASPIIGYFIAITWYSKVKSCY